jgi:hypothetical protein
MRFSALVSFSTKWWSNRSGHVSFGPYKDDEIALDSLRI